MSKLNTSDTVAKIILALPADVFRSPPVQLALEAWSALRQSNVVRFFNIAKRATILQVRIPRDEREISRIFFFGLFHTLSLSF